MRFDLKPWSPLGPFLAVFIDPRFALEKCRYRDARGDGFEPCLLKLLQVFAVDQRLGQLSSGKSSVVQALVN